MFEDLLAFHAQEAGSLGRGRAAVDVEDVVLAAVGMKRVGEHAAIGRRPLALFGAQHDRAGTVAEQHAGAAIVPVEDAGEGLGANHQCGRGKARLDQAVGHRKAIDEAGANGLNVKRSAAGHAQGGLHARRRGGKRLIRRCRREHDEIEVGSLEAGVGQGPFRSLERKMRRQLAICRDVTLANAGTLLDPLIGCVHGLGEVGVGHHTLGQVGAAPLNDGTNHEPPPPACSTGASALAVTSCNLARPSTSLLLYS